jgi:hypothetical protein
LKDVDRRSGSIHFQAAKRGRAVNVPLTGPWVRPLLSIFANVLSSLSGHNS